MTKYNFLSNIFGSYGDIIFLMSTGVIMLDASTASVVYEYVEYIGLLGNHILKHRLETKELLLIDIDLNTVKVNTTGTYLVHRSKVWCFYKHIVTKDNIVYNNKTACPKCKCVFNYEKKANSTSAMRRHECFKDYLANAGQDNSIDDIMKNVPSNIKNTLRRAEVAFVAKDLRPFAALEGEGMHDLLSAFSAVAIHHGKPISPEMCANIISDRTTVSKRTKAYAAKYVDTLSAHLKEAILAGGIAMAVDIWKDRNQNSYVGATVHHSCDRELHEHLLAVQVIPVDKSHTAENLRPIILRILERFQIVADLEHIWTEDESGVMSLIMFITDRGGNLLSALSTYKHIHCAAHLLNSIVKHMCGIIVALLSAARALVTYFHQSLANSTLGTTLKAANITRWNSNLAMLESIVDNYEQIRNTLHVNKRMDLLSCLRKPTIEEVVSLLIDFRDATIDLEWSTKPTLHLVHPWMHNLLTDHLLVRASDSSTIKNMKLAGAEYLQKKFQLTIFHKAATFFHPNLKDFDSTRTSSNNITTTNEVYMLIRKYARFHCDTRCFLSEC